MSDLTPDARRPSRVDRSFVARERSPVLSPGWLAVPARRSSSSTASTAPALDAALLRELANTWAELAHNHFGGVLRPPALELADTSTRLGAWHPATRTISLSRALVYGQPWGTVREVFKHELAHQYVDEVMGIHDETAHGPAFTEVCRARGIDASPAGLPVVGADGSPAPGPTPIVRRIMKLLALASSANVHEAHAATNEARRLMLLHNIDAAVSVAADGFSFRHVGDTKARSDASARILAGLLGQHFFVSVIWVASYLASAARRGYVLELCGTAANLDVAVYVHGFLTATAERLWRAHKVDARHPLRRRATAFPGGRHDGCGREAGSGRARKPPRGPAHRPRARGGRRARRLPAHTLPARVDARRVVAHAQRRVRARPRGGPQHRPAPPRGLDRRLAAPPPARRVRLAAFCRTGGWLAPTVAPHRDHVGLVARPRNQRDARG